MVRIMCWLLFMAIAALFALAYLAASDSVCMKHMEPFVLEIQSKGADFEIKGKEHAMTQAVCQFLSFFRSFFLSFVRSFSLFGMFSCVTASGKRVAAKCRFLAASSLAV